MEYHQLNLSIPHEVYRDLKRWVPRGKITDFLLELTKLGLHELKFKKALEDTFGSWSGHPHSALKSGVNHYIRNLRKGRKI